MEERIAIAELRSAVGLILDAVEAECGSEIPLTADYYWHVSSEVAYNPYARPETGIHCGQLVDDLVEVRAMLSRASSEIEVWHDLAHLASLLQWLAARAQPGGDRSPT